MHVRRFPAAVLVIGALALGTLGGCGDDDDTTAATDTTEVSSDQVTVTEPDQDRDRDRDRDQLRTAVADIAAACRDDPDRLQDLVTDQQRDQLRDRLRDQSCLLDGDVEIDDDDVSVDDDTATVRATMRHRNRGDQDDRQLTWRFRWTEERGWLLDDLDVLFEE